MTSKGICRDGILRRGDYVDYYNGKALCLIGVFEGYEELGGGVYRITIKDAVRPRQGWEKCKYVAIDFVSDEEIPTLPLRRSSDINLSYYNTFKRYAPFGVKEE